MVRKQKKERKQHIHIDSAALPSINIVIQDKHGTLDFSLSDYQLDTVLAASELIFNRLIKLRELDDEVKDRSIG